MTDMRRTILWVVFTMSLVLLWDAWNKNLGKPSLFSPAPPSVGASAPGTAAPGASAVPAPVATPTTPSAGGTGAVPATPAAAAPARELVEVATDVVKASFSPQGGDLVRVELLKYEDQFDPTKNVVVFDQSATRLYVAQTGLIGKPDFPTHKTAMTVRPGERNLAEGAKEVSVSFESPESGGVKYIKTYTFKRGDYAVAVTHEVVNASGAPVQPQLYLQLVRDGNAPPGESSFYSTFTGPALYTGAKKFHKIDFKDIERGKAEVAPAATDGWVSMVQHYFASAWLLNEPLQREFFARKVDTNLYAVGAIVPLGEIAPGSARKVESTLFAGPQEEKKLETLAPGLDLVKDYGWFAMLSKPLFWLLDKLYLMLHNWGWAIVALVVLLKIAFYWLNARAYQSMAKMKSVAPKVTELRERYKDKPQQMQQEMMRIYREEKVNPMGGCLPIMVQIPVFIALYWVLLSSVEMRGAPWIGWITDLSVKDPYFILPLLMTASTLLQTWLNPTPPDPVQAKMMWIMPLVFSVMFFFFPAGLVLYWLTNNILSIAQQWFINKRLGVLK